MIIPIYWGTRGKLKKDLSTGIDYCPHCGKFTGWFLGRSLKIYHFEYIPLKSKTIAWFHMCGVCEHGKTLDEGQYNGLKQMYLPFSDKKKQIACYEQAAALAQTLPPEENSVNILMANLAQTYPVAATPQLDQEYRRRLRRLLNVPAAEQAEPVRAAAPAVMPDVPDPAAQDIPTQPAFPQMQQAAAPQAAGVLPPQQFGQAMQGANPFGAPNPAGIQNPYGTPNPAGIQNPYGTPNPAGMQNPYGTPNPAGIQNPYGTPNPAGIQNPYGTPNPAGMQNPYGTPNPYGSPAPYGAAPAAPAAPSNGSAHPHNSMFTNSSDFD